MLALGPPFLHARGNKGVPMPVDLAQRLTQMHEGLMTSSSFNGLSFAHVVSAYANPNPMAVTDDLVDRSEETLNKRVVADCRPSELADAFKALIPERQKGSERLFQDVRVHAPVTREDTARRSEFTYGESSGATLIRLAVNQVETVMTNMSKTAMGLSALAMVGNEADITGFFTGKRGDSGFEVALKMMAKESLGVSEDEMSVERRDGALIVNSPKGQVVAVNRGGNDVRIVYIVTHVPVGLAVGEDLQKALAYFAERKGELAASGWYDLKLESVENRT